MKKEYNFLKKISKQVRYETIKLVHLTKTAHLGSSLSCIDILVASYFSKNSPAREAVEVSVLPKNVNVEISVIAVK